MTGRAWTTKELAVLKQMASAGATAADIAKCLPGRSKDGVRGRAAGYGISLRQARATATRLWLTPDIALRLRLVARAKGMTPTQLARDLLSAVLHNRHREHAIDSELANAVSAMAKASATIPVPVPLAPVSFHYQPQLLGRMF